MQATAPMSCCDLSKKKGMPGLVSHMGATKIIIIRSDIQLPGHIIKTGIVNNLIYFEIYFLQREYSEYPEDPGHRYNGIFYR